MNSSIHRIWRGKEDLALDDEDVEMKMKPRNATWVDSQEDQALLHVVHDAPALREPEHQGRERVVAEDEVRRFPGDGGATAHRHGDVGAVERRRVVHTVAGDGDDALRRPAAAPGGVSVRASRARTTWSRRSPPAGRASSQPATPARSRFGPTAGRPRRRSRPRYPDGRPSRPRAGCRPVRLAIASWMPAGGDRRTRQGRERPPGLGAATAGQGTSRSPADWRFASMSSCHAWPRGVVRVATRRGRPPERPGRGPRLRPVPARPCSGYRQARRTAGSPRSRSAGSSAGRPGTPAARRARVNEAGPDRLPRMPRVLLGADAPPATSRGDRSSSTEPLRRPDRASASRFSVIVPVLSVTMRSTAPSVSSALRRRTSTLRRSSRYAPRPRITASRTGGSSGMAAIAAEIPARTFSPRVAPRATADAQGHETMRPIATTSRMRTEPVELPLQGARRRSRVAEAAIRPNSVAGPMATTTPSPRPPTTLVPA